ncbi:MAG: Fic family protein [Kiritimatiellae bacterium]|jgi:Fic family protein|nr:Fic family protein [Kiritimatiellia bacterium]
MNSKLKFLPPDINCETVAILNAANKASRALGQLKGEISKIPNSQILIDTLALQEAKDSNEIENIVTTDDEIYQASIDETIASISAKEAVNYAKALHEGIKIVGDNKTITINQIIHLQSIISPNHPIRKLSGTVLKNTTTNEVIYTPPQSYDEIIELLKNFEIYFNTPEFHNIDSLIKMPIIHYQFESIHPFYDGNGRTGRLLNMLYLVMEGLLDIPVLYLSSYIIKHKLDYYQLLQDVRTKGNLEEWIIWVLKGVEETAMETIVVVNNIKKLMDTYKVKIKNNFNFYSHDLINIIFKHPYTKTSFLERELKIHRNTAAKYLKSLADANMLIKLKIGKSNYYVNSQLLNLLKNR